MMPFSLLPFDPMASNHTKLIPAAARENFQQACLYFYRLILLLIAKGAGEDNGGKRTA
jgi:hypothetical protein